MPWASPDRQYGRLAKSLDDAIGFGITTVVEPQNSLDDLELYERARTEGRLRSRIVAALFHPRGTGGADLDAFAETARRYAGDRLRVGPLKWRWGARSSTAPDRCGEPPRAQPCPGLNAGGSRPGASPRPPRPDRG
ncbi:hypothetical protein [Streptomyces sp. NPDC048269]|uniref:hypothetical protein n=1 Tax=Streptomyces sp. NPDC048269 TaxID=3155753 RepID=UPI003427B5A8